MFCDTGVLTRLKKIQSSWKFNQVDVKKLEWSVFTKST
jgi:hypothetical protein